MDMPKIRAIEFLNGKKILVKFENDTSKVYDCSPLIKTDRYQRLQNDWLFKRAKVDAGGYGIFWNEDIDLSDYELWTNGKQVDARF